MVIVFKTEYAGTVVHTRSGKERVIPARFQEQFYIEQDYKREIAKFDSLEGILRLRSDYILHGASDFKNPVYYRALEGQFADQYKELFEMLNITEDTPLSEYTYA